MHPTRKMRLAYFGVKYFPARGGVSRTTENLIRNLKDEYEITIYCYAHPRAGTHVPGVRTVQFPELRVPGIGIFIYFMMCFVHLMVFGNHDLLHVRKIDAAFFLPLLALKYPRILATSHESPYLRDKWGSLARAYFRLGEWIFIRSKATLTVISEPLACTYRERYGREVRFVPNGVEPVKSFAGSEADQVFAAQEVVRPYLSFAARRIMATKGAHTMLQALRSLDFDGTVVIAGEETHAGDYISRLDRLSVGLDVRRVGYITDKVTLLDIIGRSDCFIFPSETEGMSIMLLEVAALGVPIIASDIPENRAVFDPTEVTFFANKDAQALAQKVRWVLDHPDDVATKALKAKEKVHNQYSGTVMTNAYRELYEALLTSR